MPTKFICKYEKDELEKLYLQENHTLKEMCEIVGCKSPITMSKILHENGIDTDRNQRVSFQKRGNRSLKELQFFLIREYYQNQRSMESIAKELGISHVIVRKYLESFGFPIRTKSQQQTGTGSSNWAGGVNIKSNGYVEIYSPNHPNANKRKYVYQHQLVAEKKIGRYLKKGEVVHHIDSNKSNNDPENLVVLSNNNHIKLHNLLKKGFSFNEAIKTVEVINE